MYGLETEFLKIKTQYALKEVFLFSKKKKKYIKL